MVDCSHTALKMYLTVTPLSLLAGRVELLPDVRACFLQPPPLFITPPSFDPCFHKLKVTVSVCQRWPLVRPTEATSGGIGKYFIITDETSSIVSFTWLSRCGKGEISDVLNSRELMNINPHLSKLMFKPEQKKGNCLGTILKYLYFVTAAKA